MERLAGCVVKPAGRSEMSLSPAKFTDAPLTPPLCNAEEAILAPKATVIPAS